MATKKVNPKNNPSVTKTVPPRKPASTKLKTDTANQDITKKHSEAKRLIADAEDGHTKASKVIRGGTISKTVKNEEIAKTRKTNSVKANPTVEKRTSMTTVGRAGSRNQPVRGTKINNSEVNRSVKMTRRQDDTNNDKQPKATKSNAVLDNYHNVTIASPPQKRREIQNVQHSEEEAAQPQRNRKLTKTLEPEEILVLKRDSAKHRIEAEIQRQEKLSTEHPVKSSIAFEVSFDEKNRVTTTQPASINKTEDADMDLDRYSDDFESYESDFESGESSSSAHEISSTSSNSDVAPDDELHDKTEANAETIISTEAELGAESEEESELTQNPITVIHRGKEVESKLDSGHYEMNFRKQLKLSDPSPPITQFYSNDPSSMANVEELDSGVSYDTSTQIEPFKITSNSTSCYGGYIGFYAKSVLSKRGLELMSKIRLDKLTYKLLEMTPLNYDVYMQSYGKLNTIQSATQTQIQNMTADTQTDEEASCDVWTQHPPWYDRQTNQQISGEGQNVVYQMDINLYENSLEQLRKMDQTRNQRTLKQQIQRHMKPTNFNRLNSFLQRSSLLMLKVMSLKTKQKQNISGGQSQLNAGFLNALRVRRVFGSTHHQLLITVHECHPDNDVYRSDFANLLIIWSTTDLKNPLRLLSTWAEVCHAEFCADSTDIVLCGLRDGSIAMWDLRETYSYCSKLDGHLKHFAATQSVMPSLAGAESQKLLDLGPVVDVKSFRVTSKLFCTQNSFNHYKPIQFTSLNDTGIIAIWTLIDTTAQSSTASRPIKRQATMSSTRFEHSSPWSRVKLTQSAICDLRTYLEQRLSLSQTQFIHTKSNFQKNVYSDDLLRELKDNQSAPITLQGLRFTSIDTGCESIYVCTNRNLIINCSKSLNPERFTHIRINESRFLFPTALCVLSNDSYLAVGLSNGSVLIINCDPRKLLKHKNKLPNELAYSQESHLINLSNFPESETGKSCAIQNIILNERLTSESRIEHADDFKFRPLTAIGNDLLVNRKRSFELQAFDQHLIMNGLTLRKDLVQSIVLSSDGWSLYVLTNGILRAYDFNLDKEKTLNHFDIRCVVDIAVAKRSHNSEQLVILNEQNDVNLYLQTN